MTTGHEAQRLREEVEALSRGRGGRRYPHALEARIVAYARSRRAEGARWDLISAETGVPVETVRGWTLRETEVVVEARSASSKALVPVHVVPAIASERVVSVVSPTGFRIEGLSLSEAVATLRALA